VASTWKAGRLPLNSCGGPRKGICGSGRRNSIIDGSKGWPVLPSKGRSCPSARSRWTPPHGGLEHRMDVVSHDIQWSIVDGPVVICQEGLAGPWMTDHERT
jgi:hypothetical protein